jgi:FMN-dependent NADH-azoreductase
MVNEPQTHDVSAQLLCGFLRAQAAHLNSPLTNFHFHPNTREFGDRINIVAMEG